MRQLFNEGLVKMQAGDIDARLSRRPVERYQWPLGAALCFLATSFLMRERKRVRAVVSRRVEAKKTLAMAAIFLLLANLSFAAAPGLDAYRQDNFPEAYQEFEKTLKEHPQTNAADKIEFDAGAAAYKMKDFNKALNSFSQALLSPDAGLQSRSHYNLGNTLYQRGDGQKKDDEKLKDWTNALQHYEQSLKIAPDNKEAQENLEYVKRKIEELKRKREQQPTPSPSPKPQDKKKDDSKKDDKDQQKDQQPQKQNQQKKQDQQQQDQKDQSGQGDQQKPDKGDDQSQAKNEAGKDKNKDQPKPDETPSPSPSPGNDEQSQQNQQGPSPSPQSSAGSDKGDQKDSPKGDQEKPDQSPTPSDQENGSPSPSPGEGEGPGNSPNPTPGSSPAKRMAGEVKGAGDEKPNQDEQSAEVAEAEPEKDGQMSEKQAELLLQSMKDEERRVQLDERKVSRRVYKDW
jgi:Ca-activated chloride channel family protein